MAKEGETQLKELRPEKVGRLIIPDLHQERKKE
jgi:hypothetical protein